MNKRKAWRAANPEKVRERNAKWRAANRDTLEDQRPKAMSALIAEAERLAVAPVAHTCRAGTGARAHADRASPSAR